jgi:hypothetical protein
MQAGHPLVFSAAPANNAGPVRRFCGTILRQRHLNESSRRQEQPKVRKLIAFDDDTFDKLTQLGRDRMATIQELADEAFADVLKKHGIPIDLKDALRKSASRPNAAAKRKTKLGPGE